MIRVHLGCHIFIQTRGVTKVKFPPYMQGKDRPYWIQSLEAGKGVKNSIGFTTVGKPKMAQKQFNSPLEMYGEDALEEIMKEGTLG